MLKQVEGSGVIAVVNEGTSQDTTGTAITIRHLRIVYS